MTRTVYNELAAWLLLAPAVCGQLRVPNRANKPLFEGQQGRQNTEIYFDPSTGKVTLKLLVQDANGYFIPNIRRENFVVYENGVRQNSRSVDVEHAPVSVGLLLEHGGRRLALSRDLVENVSTAGRELLKVLGGRDQAGIWLYDDHVEQLSGFTRDRESLESLLIGLAPPEVSETNLYDALIRVAGKMDTVKGRRATVVLTSCVDTFSKATYEDALTAAGQSRAPIYVISLANEMRLAADLHSLDSTQRPNWSEAEGKLMELARRSGGRLYSPKTILDLSPAYDDMMENLKVRYVITYRSSNSNAIVPRTVRVELVNAADGGPLRIVDENGVVVNPTVVLQESYTPISTPVSTAQ